jgi:predicted nucleic acid-binding protein
MKLKIYVETSVISFLLAKDAPEKMKITQEFFKKVMKDYDVFISELVLAEIEKSPEPQKSFFINIIEKYKLNALKLNEEARKLADEYLKAKIVPKKYFNDVFHIAVATVNNMDVIVSWNLRHIVKLSTKIKVKEINSRLGYKDIEISAPEEVI